ncbi:MAG: sterol desaturase family protein [Opitutaceae bacterium]
MTELPVISAGWRTALAVGGLGVLLGWETARPFFATFANRAARARHGMLNLALGGLNILLTTLVFATAWLAVTNWTATHGFGLLHWLNLDGWSRTLLAILLLDGWTYLWHRLNHAVPFLWRFHRLHHADRAMDVTTASRFHTGEIFLSSLLRLPVLAIIGCRIEELALYELLLFAVVQFHHANIALPAWLDRGMRAAIVTPSMHKVHHSVARGERDSNYSSLFSWWDRIFHTHRVAGDLRAIVFGLEAERPVGASPDSAGNS